MRTITITLEIPSPTPWEISVLTRLTRGVTVAPGGLLDGYTAQKASWIERLFGYGAIAHRLPGENGNQFYFITEIGKAILAQASENSTT